MIRHATVAMVRRAIPWTSAGRPRGSIEAPDGADQRLACYPVELSYGYPVVDPTIEAPTCPECAVLWDVARDLEAALLEWVIIHGSIKTPQGWRREGDIVILTEDEAAEMDRDGHALRRVVNGGSAW